MKKCGRCKQEKPLSEFYPNHSRSGSFMVRCKPCQKKSTAEWKKSKPNYEKDRYLKEKPAVRERHLKRKYGIGHDDYKAMLIIQNGVCAICGHAPNGNRPFDVDHCHRTRVVRGLLCSNCNRILGYAHDKIAVLESAIVYLKSLKLLPVQSTKP